MDHGLMLEQSFAACKFAPVVVNKLSGKPTSILPSRVGTWKTTSFFIDSSGRSTFALPLELTFASKADLDIFLAAKCLSPPPSYDAADHDPVETHNADAERNNDVDASVPAGEVRSDQPEGSVVAASVALEVTSYSIDDGREVAVEGVTVTSTAVDGLVVSFDALVTVRATFHDSVSLPNTPSGFSATGGAGGDYTHREPKDLNVVTNLEVTPVLTMMHTKQNVAAIRGDGGEDDVPDLVALELAAIPDQMQKSSIDRIREARLRCVSLRVTVTHAFTIAVKSVPGPSGNTRMGNTLVSLTIRHSCSHTEPVIITNVAIHPGHSRHEMVTQTKSGAPQVQQAVTNMTKSVRWGYAPNAELSLPITLHPREAYSTILFVNAGEDMMSRSFISPVSVTGVVGSMSNDDGNEKGKRNSYDQCRVVVAGDAHWTTELVAVDPADAFRVQTTVLQPIVHRGEPMTVKFRIFNLSLETRNLMLLVSKEQRRDAALLASNSTSKEEAVNAAVVSEANGYTFGVWGISGDDDGTVRLNRDFELLAIDNALMLGNLQGQHAVDAELRFVPLRLGRLQVPDWKLYDKGANRWYTCSHNLSVVAM